MTRVTVVLLSIVTSALVVGLTLDFKREERNEAFERKCVSQSGVPVITAARRVCLDSYSVSFVEEKK